MSSDSATAYETFAHEFLKARDQSTIGVNVIGNWARSLDEEIDVLEIGCGAGFPVTRVLSEFNLKLWAVDSSTTLLAKFKFRFPKIPVDCAKALDSKYFDRKFGAAIAIGLVFLLTADEQKRFIHRLGETLLPGGRFLFTAPTEIGTWADMHTGHECRSLGIEAYEKILNNAEFRVRDTYMDEGQNHYFDAQLSSTSSDFSSGPPL